MRLAIALNALAATAAAQSFSLDRTLTSDSPALLVSFAERGKNVAALCGDGKLRVWDAQSGALLRTDAKDGTSLPGTFLSGTDEFATVDRSGGIQIWSITKKPLVRQLPAIAPRATRLAFSGDRSRVATAHMPDRQSGVNTIRVRDGAGKDLFAVPAGIGGISILGFSPDGSSMVAGSYDADLRVWNARNGELVRLIDSLPVSMFAFSFSSDGKWLATAGADRSVYVWDTADWKLVRRIADLPEMISALAFSPDGRRLVTGGFSELTMAHPVTLILWDVATAKQLRVIRAPRRTAAVAFSPDGRQVASLHGQASIHLWQVPH
jgi:WD40 repeat protein